LIPVFFKKKTFSTNVIYNLKSIDCFNPMLFSRNFNRLVEFILNIQRPFYKLQIFQVGVIAARAHR